MKLSKAQSDLLARLGTDAEIGLTTDQASARREGDGTFNVVDPPINCPSWVCCLLPCIRHVPSMKTFNQIKPEDAEVKRNGKWVRYDASSLVRGDIIRLEAGDIVPADAVAIDSSADLLVDHRLVTGEDKPVGSSSSGGGEGGDEGDLEAAADGTPADARPPLLKLFWGGQVVQGSAVAAVTAIGPRTLAASLIRQGQFPPKGNVLLLREADGIFRDDGGVGDDDAQAGISLLNRADAAALPGAAAS